MFGLFNGKNKINQVVDGVALILNTTFTQLEIDFDDPALIRQAEKDLYLLAYINGAIAVAAEIAGLSNQQTGTAFINAGQRLFTTGGDQFAQLHLQALKSNQELSLSGFKDGATEFRSAFGRFIGDHEIKRLSKLEMHLKVYVVPIDSKIIDGVLGEYSHEGGSYSYKNWDDWYQVFKTTCGEYNKQLSVGEDGKSLLDFMENEPLKNAFKDKVDPKSLAKDYAEQFDISSLL